MDTKLKTGNLATFTWEESKVLPKFLVHTVFCFCFCFFPLQDNGTQQGFNQEDQVECTLIYMNLELLLMYMKKQ